MPSITQHLSGFRKSRQQKAPLIGECFRFSGVMGIRGILLSMKSIREWQTALKVAADQRFPNSGWDDIRRVQSIQEQLNDVKSALEVECGKRVSDNHAHQDPNHRIGALIADILILAEERGADIEGELEKVLAWFEDRN